MLLLAVQVFSEAFGGLAGPDPLRDKSASASADSTASRGARPSPRQVRPRRHPPPPASAPSCARAHGLRRDVAPLEAPAQAPKVCDDGIAPVPQKGQPTPLGLEGPVEVGEVDNEPGKGPARGGGPCCLVRLWRGISPRFLFCFPLFYLLQVLFLLPAPPIDQDEAPRDWIRPWRREVRCPARSSSFPIFILFTSRSLICCPPSSPFTR